MKASIWRTPCAPSRASWRSRCAPRLNAPPEGRINPGGSLASQPLFSRRKPPFLFSLGTKMVLVTACVLLASFGLCALATLSLTRQLLKSELQVTAARRSGFLAEASEDLVSRDLPADRRRLETLAGDFMGDPALGAVEVMDRSRR